MTHFHLRSQPDQDPLEPPAILLDWFGRGATVQVRQNLMSGIRPPSVAIDFLRFAGGVYCADKLASRPADRWTRSLTLDFPVRDLAPWDASIEGLRAALSFLSGDEWCLNPYLSTEPYPSLGAAARPIDAVCLFSGGLDSFVGAVNLLAEGKSVCLVAHHEGGQASQTQKVLAGRLAARYGRERIVLRRLFLRPAPRSSFQRRQLPETRESSTRTRSLLFVAAGLVVAAGYGPEVPLFVPENGFIGINVPLTAARKGSLSTRTTHPHFIAELGTCVKELGLSNPIINPFQLLAKGEMVAACHDQETVLRLARRTLSCAHPEAARYAQRAQGNCGYCFPCLIRRAALHHVGLDDPLDYAFDALNDSASMDGHRGADLRALVRSLHASIRPLDVLRNGPVPPHLITEFTEVVKRGRAEILAWLCETSNAPSLQRQLPCP